MGDRTDVTLTVLTAQTEAVGVIGPGWSDKFVDGQCTSFEYNEVNYGELEFLDALEKAGIAYDSDWEAGDEFPKGRKSCRFTAEGASEVKEVYDTYRNPNIQALMARIDDFADLRQYILHHNKRVTSLPWDNQEEYGKRYRVKQLISA